MDFFSWLYPLEWIVANIMVIWHRVFDFMGLDPAGGAAWALSIVGLVVTIRMLLIPLFVKQINASRAMQVIAPDLKKIQDKYRGKKDQASREAMSRETMELYAKHRTNPFASCLPMLVQAPIFFALFRVLNGLEGQANETAGIGWLTPELAAQAQHATIFGAQLSDSFMDNTGSLSAKIVSAVLILAMVATTFTTQHQLTRKNMPKAALEGPMARQQQILMYALPFIFIITGPNFPVGVLIYWTTTNLWTMGQQYYVIKRNPTPGSEAERIYKEKQAEKEKHKALRRGDITQEELDARAAEEAAVARGQRQQPKKGQSRAKRKPAQQGATQTPDASDDAEDDHPDSAPDAPDDPGTAPETSTKPKNKKDKR